MIKILPSTINLPLKKGDLFSSIAISSAIEEEDEKKIIAGLNIFHDWGLVADHEYIRPKQWGYLAGDDLSRFRNLHSKRQPSLITFIRGGWGAARLLEHPQPWKKGWMLGFSDTTSILLSRLAAGFDGCIHGPMITSIAKEPKWSQHRLRQLLFGEAVPDLKGESWNAGLVKGPLVAANLTVATHLIGTTHMPNLKGAILVLEDIGEEPYRIDRMLTQWRLAGILQNLGGLCFGKFINCEGEENIADDKTFKLNEILKDRIKDINIPTISNLPVGHCTGNAALPLGREVILDGYKGKLKFISS